MGYQQPNDLYIIILCITENAIRNLWHPDTVKFYEFYLAYSNSNRSQRFVGYIKKNIINILKLILHLIVLLISIYTVVSTLDGFYWTCIMMIYETKEELKYVFDKNQYPPEIKD